MPTDPTTPYLSGKPRSVEEALIWLRIIVSQVPHGKTYHQLGLELQAANDIVFWLMNNARWIEVERPVAAEGDPQP